MIYTVTFNPAVDYVMHPLTLDMGFTNRSSSEEVRCGGNGINVSSILNELNVDTICLGIIAGFTGDYILDTLQSAGVTCNFVRLDKGFTRINVKLNGIVMTIINGMGPKTRSTSCSVALTASRPATRSCSRAPSPSACRTTCTRSS